MIKEIQDLDDARARVRDLFVGKGQFRLQDEDEIEA
jgi:hypothetical protein